MKTEKKGFTLIELLVVIAIIGLLSTLSIIALNSARARARDAKRISDVRSIQLALEMHYNEYNSYPTSTAVVAGASIGPAAAPFLRSYPTPPSPVDGGTTLCPATTGTHYVYRRTNDTVAQSASYTVSFCLGAAVNEVAAGVNHMTPGGINPTATANY